MKMLKIIAPFILVCFLISCKKEDSTNNNGNTSSKIKTYREDVIAGTEHDSATFDVGYDNSDRIISLISESNPGDKFLYSYGTGKNTMDIYNSGVLSIHNEFYLDSRSFIDSAFQYNDTQDTSSDKYVYNSANQLIKDIFYDIEDGVATIDDETDYTWNSDGNISQSTDGSATNSYEYYTDKLNNINLFVGFSATSKNLVKTTTGDLGGQQDTFTHIYTFDSQNRVLSETASDNIGNTVMKTYTYY